MTTMNRVVAFCLTFFLCGVNVTSGVSDDGSVPLNDELAEIRRYMAEMKKNYDTLQLQSEVRFLRRKAVFLILDFKSFIYFDGFFSGLCLIVNFTKKYHALKHVE